MTLKLIFGIAATIITTASFLPYIRDIFAKKTKPHIYSWLIWSILQTTGVIAMVVGHAGWGALGLGIGCLFCTLIFFLSFKYGTKNITTFDTVCLIGAICAILVWIFLKNPLYSVILITIIDFVGFIPTYRKSYFDPHSETTSLYTMSVISELLNLFAITSYSFTTTLYVASLAVTNFVCVFILITRRKVTVQNL